MNATNHTRLATLTLPLCLTAALVSACTQHTPAPAVASTAPPAVAYPSHEAAGGIVPPGGALHNPHAGDKLVAATGAQLFTTMNCDGCHGPDASGAVGPNLGDGRWRYGGADPEVFMSIYYGAPRACPPSAASSARMACGSS